jgi:pyruvate dehydrogenase E2 component (dihydrolipoamide acetyltransferase)
MRFEMKMPDVSTNDSDVRIVRWLIGLGERIERGRPLLEVETDKATMEVESAVSGVLDEIRSQPDETVPVGHVIAVLEAEAVAHAPASGNAPRGMFARNRASMAEKTPSQNEQISKSPNLQISKSNLQSPIPNPFAACPHPSPLPKGEGTGIAAHSLSLTQAQRVAGKRLQESKQTVPHFYLQTSVDATAMIACRKAAEPAKLVWDAFFVAAVAKAIGRFDRFRCRLEGERLVPAETDAIGVAIDVDNELYVVPIDSPAGKTVEQISEEIRRAVERLRAGDAEAKKIRPALMTITNLGVANVEGFIPVINPPEAAILGIGRIAPQPVVLADGGLGVRPRCMVTLGADHRIVSGRYAGEFLGAIVEELEGGCVRREKVKGEKGEGEV